MEPQFLTEQEVLCIHDTIISKYGGLHGIRDKGLLESALAAPSSSFGGIFIHASLTEMAAAYLFHIAKNHPFLDGNKRTAFACMDIFLQKNGYDFFLSTEDTFQFVLDVATSKFSLKEEIAFIIEQNTTPYEEAA